MGFVGGVWGAYVGMLVVAGVAAHQGPVEVLRAGT